eukprot:NODE_24006_length_642_cov_2.675728.p3 GENE.NODE_24006_length_642_cov_2.675728~~NODE_24006_length_642_cov_2.675728.p3  ORF type:complete len:123 (-),score=14.19 NODE_24006_length_642_cov_2.675728:170-538(-)
MAAPTLAAPGTREFCLPPNKLFEEQLVLCIARSCQNVQWQRLLHSSGFALAALDGADDGRSSTWAAKVCAVLPCHRPGQSCISFQYPIDRGLSGVTLVSALLWPCLRSSPLTPAVPAKQKFC